MRLRPLNFFLGFTVFIFFLSVVSPAALAKTILATGHEVANYSFAHRHAKDLDDAAMEREIVGAQKNIATQSGLTPKWYWPPFLETSDASAQGRMIWSAPEQTTPHVVAQKPRAILQNRDNCRRRLPQAMRK